MLLQDAGCCERRLETVSGVPPDHLPEAPERDAAGRRLGIVSQPVQVALDARRRGAPLNDLPFCVRKRGYRRRRAAHQKGISPVSETLERVKGIEPSSSAWKAVALPLSYTRIATLCDKLSSNRKDARRKTPVWPSGRSGCPPSPKRAWPGTSKDRVMDPVF